MTLLRAIALLLGLLAGSAAAIAADPFLATCRAFGERELLKEDAGVKALVIDDDRHLYLERKARKLGSQAVAAVLSGDGALVREVGPAVEISFVCLLAGERRALWFQWLPRRDAAALVQCRRGDDVQGCLQVLLDLAERDLVEMSSIRFQQSQDAGAGDAFRAAAAAWRNYRDLECARHGAEGSDEWRACRVDLSRRRYFDLR